LKAGEQFGVGGVAATPANRVQALRSLAANVSRTFQSRHALTVQISDSLIMENKIPLGTTAKDAEELTDYMSRFPRATNEYNGILKSWMRVAKTHHAFGAFRR